MSWARYDDELPLNRKVAWLKAHGTAGIAALGLHLLANTWSRHEGHQGFIPSYIPEQLVGRPWRQLVGLLADDAVGMFIEVEEGWIINDYDEFGDRDDGVSVEEKKARLSQIRRAAGAAGGRKKAENRASKTPSKKAGLPRAAPAETQPNASENETKTNRKRNENAAEVPSTLGVQTATPPENIEESSSKPLAQLVANAQQSSTPVPVPEPPNSTTVEKSVTSVRLATATNSPPPDHCSQHPHGSSTPCRDCGAARRQRTRWDKTHAAELAKLKDRCPYCHASGWIEDLDGNPTQKCDHVTPPTNQARTA